MSAKEKYEAVIGLEIHAQLLTKSKAFSSDSAAYGGRPNEHVSVVSLGHPGTLPRMNKKQIEYAVRMGLACDCEIRHENYFARKNYFYADLPKGYQISQFDTPVCYEGHLYIESGDEKKKVRITRIHMEEDSGKSMHDQDPFFTLIDLNRAGVPLIEIVTEPDLRNGEEAYAFITKIRQIIRYLEICDGNMEEGSLRCDANVSVRLKGDEKLGRKVEVKNMNSIRNVRRAIEHEIERQIEIIEKGGKINEDTRSFDAVNGTTFSMRSKEMLHDYRYFPEPDLPPLILNEEYIHKVHRSMPALPDELFKKYRKDFQLSDYDAGILTDDKGIALYFEELTKHTKNYKAAANWLMGPVKSWLNDHAVDIQDFVLEPGKIASIIQLVSNNKISHSMAEQKLFPAMIKEPEKEPAALAEELNLMQESDEGKIENLIEEVLNELPDKVEEYKKGKHGLLGLFMGQVMKKSGGKVDPKKANKLLRDTLNQQ